MSLTINRLTSTAAGGAIERSASWALWSPDGRTIAFVVDARDLAGRAPVPGNRDDVEDLFLHDVATGATRQVTFNGLAPSGAGPYNGGQDTRIAAFSADGSTLIFNSDGPRPIPGEAADPEWIRNDAFVVDVASGAVTRLTRDARTASSEAVAVSRDGRLVLLETNVPVGPGDAFDEASGSPSINDGNYGDDVVLVDRAAGTYTRLTSDAAGNPGDLDSTPVAFSPDERWVLFESRATNLAGITGADSYNATFFYLAGTIIPIWTYFDTDVFLYDRVTGATTRITTKANGDATNASSDAYGFSPDGRYVLFDSAGEDIRGVAGADANGTGDAFVFDFATGASRRISNDAAGNAANGSTTPVAFAGDGRTVLVESRATNLAGVAGADGNGKADVFVVDVATGLARRVSNDAAGNAANGDSRAVAISPDGRRVLFESQASNLAGQTGARYESDQWDLFVADLGTGAITRLSTNRFGRPAGAEEYNGRQDPPANFSPDGSRVVFGAGNDGQDPKDYAGLRANWGTLFVADLPPPPVPGAGDGPTADLVWRGAGGEVRLWGTSASGAAADAAVATVSPDWRIATAADLTGDGRADLVWRGPGGEVRLWSLRDGRVASDLELARGVGAEWRVAGAGDLDANGSADLVWRNAASGEVRAWTFAGGAVVGDAGVAAVPTDWTIAGVGDLTGDGRADLVWRGPGGEVRLWGMNGSAVIADAGIAVVPTAWRIAAVADLTGDGRADLLWRGPGGEVRLWAMDGAAVRADLDLAAGGGVGANWRVALAADVTGDGIADLVWRDTAGGEVRLWTLGPGGVVAADARLAVVPPSVWDIVNSPYDLG